jgi:hypothetical protein
MRNVREARVSWSLRKAGVPCQSCNAQIPHQSYRKAGLSGHDCVTMQQSEDDVESLHCPYCGEQLEHTRDEGRTQFYRCDRCGLLSKPPFGALRHVQTVELKNDPQFVLAAVIAWQRDQHVSGLRCPNNGSHRLLGAAIHDDGVVLSCPDCEYRESFVPDAVIKRYIETSRGTWCAVPYLPEP